MAKLPTVDDVASLAGVSTATVSRCINEPDRVREKTRLRVNEAIEQLGYTPNFGGRALASNRTRTVGVVIPTMDNAIFAEAMQVLEEELAIHGYTVFISSSQYSPERESAQIKSLLARGVDALVLVGSENRPGIDALIEQRRIPCINLWTAKPFRGRATIGFKNKEAASRVAAYIFQQGHREIAFISGIVQGNGRAQGRLEGVVETLASYEYPIPENWIAQCRYEFDSAKEVALQWLTQPKAPSAIICGNDVLATGVLMAAHELRRKVPQELSIMGFDDLDFVRALSPPLSTVRVPHRRMGKRAGTVIVQWLNGDFVPTDTVFTADLVLRGSIAAVVQ